MDAERAIAEKQRPGFVADLVACEQEGEGVVVLIDALGEGNYGSYIDFGGKGEGVDLVADFGWEVEEAEDIFFLLFFFFFSLAGLRDFGRCCHYDSREGLALKVCWGVEVVLFGLF